MIRSILAASSIALALSLSLFLPAGAKTFRFAYQGDILTHDPHAQNENFNNMANSQIYEQLLSRDKQVRPVPCLATEWSQSSPTVWVFKLRHGVKWQDGSAFTADDVVFSILRAQLPTSNMKVYATAVGKPRKIDDYTVEFTTPVPNPVMLEMLSAGNLFIMSKAWAIKYKVGKPQDYNNKEETYAMRNAMGTGPFILVSHEADVKTVMKKNPNWWGLKENRFEGNVDEWIFTPIKSPQTRAAALLTGDVDFVLDPPLQDVEKLRQDPSIKIFEGRENRIMMIGMDQGRDELLYANVKGKNPFKDRRVRLAMYQAVDVEALKRSVMRGLAVPTAFVMSNPAAAGLPATMDRRYPYDVAAAKKLMSEAGYGNGFEVTLDCPNDRYKNDEKICVALAAMWSKIGITVKVAAIPKANYFPKVQKLDTSLYLLGWGGPTTDAIFTLKPVLHSRNDSGAGEYNWGNYKAPELDRLIDAIEGEMELVKRQSLILQAMQLHHDLVLHIPLHLQVSPWAAKKNVQLVHRADNWVDLTWVRIN